MLKSNSKSMRNHVVSPEEEEERLQCQQWEGFVETSGAWFTYSLRVVSHWLMLWMLNTCRWMPSPWFLIASFSVFKSHCKLLLRSWQSCELHYTLCTIKKYTVYHKKGTPTFLAITLVTIVRFLQFLAHTSTRD